VHNVDSLLSGMEGKMCTTLTVSSLGSGRDVHNVDSLLSGVRRDVHNVDSLLPPG